MKGLKGLAAFPALQHQLSVGFRPKQQVEIYDKKYMTYYKFAT